jgi:hypothetical protein
VIGAAAKGGGGGGGAALLFVLGFGAHWAWDRFVPYEWRRTRALRHLRRVQRKGMARGQVRVPRSAEPVEADV